MQQRHELIRRLQSRIARRQNEIAYLEDLRSTYSFFRQLSALREVREQIKPLAIEQKLDKDILKSLTHVPRVYILSADFFEGDDGL